MIDKSCKSHLNKLYNNVSVFSGQNNLPGKDHKKSSNNLCSNKVKDLRIKYPSNIVISFLNINSIRNKIDTLMNFATGNIDIFGIAETKIDESFPVGQFVKQGYKTPYRLDASSTSGGLLVYVNENIPSRPLLKLTLPSDIQLIPFELCLRKTKWLIIITKTCC